MTDTGRRSTDLDERTIAVLKAWRRRQREERDNDLVFPRPEGTPTSPTRSPSPSTVSSRAPRSHEPTSLLRHTHTSVLLKAGVPVKVVSERLGHANPAFTITVYQHIIPGMQADAATVFRTT